MEELPQDETPKRARGRPKLADGDKAIRAQVSLDRATIDRARELGDGNLSDGIRKAVAWTLKK